MKAIVLTPVILFTVGVLTIYVASTKTPATPIARATDYVLKPRTAPPVAEAAPSLPTAQAAKPPTTELQRLENQLADLEHEIERGEYVRIINDPQTAPGIKSELRARLRRFSQLTLELTRMHMEQLGQSSL